jgi:hypothetical protein
MSNASDEDATAGPDIGISDDQLPEDLVPSEDNPLAEGLGDGESPGDLLHDGRTAVEDEDEGDSTDGTDSGTSGDSA